MVKIKYASIFVLLVSGLRAEVGGCPHPGEDLSEKFRRYTYRIENISAVAIPYLRIIETDTAVNWCLWTDGGTVAASDDGLGMKILLAEDRNKPDFNWKTQNRLPLIKVSMLEAGFLNATSVGFLAGILHSGISFFAAIHFDLKYFLHKENRLFLVFEGAVSKYEPSPSSQVTYFQDFYSNLIFNYRVHTYKRVDIFYGLGGGLTGENYTLRGENIQNYAAQFKTGTTLRVNLSQHASLNVLFYYRFNPDRLIYDSRFMYGVSAGYRF
jgi:hypothetical protein